MKKDHNPKKKKPSKEIQKVKIGDLVGKLDLSDYIIQPKFPHIDVLKIAEQFDITKKITSQIQNEIRPALIAADSFKTSYENLKPLFAINDIIKEQFSLGQKILGVSRVLDFSKNFAALESLKIMKMPSSIITEQLETYYENQKRRVELLTQVQIPKISTDANFALGVSRTYSDYRGEKYITERAVLIGEKSISIKLVP